MNSRITVLLAAGILSAPLAANAGAIRSASGSLGDLSWTAQSVIVGVTSTGTVASGGDPRYLAPMPQYSGVVSLIMNYGAGGSFICSGTLLPDRQSILTAAHCVSDGAGTAGPLSTTAYFYGGAADIVVPFNPASTAVGVSQYFVHQDYTGQVIDQNDVAVLRLAAPAPAFAQSYDMFTGDISGQDFNVAGYGLRSTVGGNDGVAFPATTAGTGRLRQGDNRYDFRFGDSDWGGFWDGGVDGFFGTAANQYTYLSDFDNGRAANDTSCRIAAAFGLGGAKYCNLGRGPGEVGIAGGDSGGPGFIGGKVASINSFGLSFGTAFGDIRAGLNSSFGEFSGYVPVFLHSKFISAALVPEPGTLALFGLGLVGLGWSRRRRDA